MMDSPTSTIAASPVPSPAHSWSSGYSSASTLMGNTSFLTGIHDDLADDPASEIDIGAFCLACLQGGDILQAYLASSEVDLNGGLPDGSGDNVFHSILRIAADQFKDGKGEVVKSLLRNGADPLARNRLGDNILHILAGSTEQESHDLLGFLLDGDTTDLSDVRAACREAIDQQNDFGDTPLIVAVLYNQPHSVQLLLRNGADGQISGEFDMTALEIAVSRAYHEVIDVLRQYSE